MPTTLPPAPPSPAAVPAWHSLLEERWQQRLSTLTELALAYHDAEEGCGGRPARSERSQCHLTDAVCN